MEGANVIVVLGLCRDSVQDVMLLFMMIDFRLAQLLTCRLFIWFVLCCIVRVSMFIELIVMDVR